MISLLSKYVLMSIKPNYAKEIYLRNKTVELRRVCPKFASNDIVLIYESSPVQRITGFFVVDEIRSLPLHELWYIAKEKAQINKKAFISYFKGIDKGTAIYIKNVSLFDVPLPIVNISPSIKAPQSYRYISEAEFTRASSLSKLHTSEKDLPHCSLDFGI